MISEFVSQFDAKREALAARFSKTPPSSYIDIVKDVISAVCSEEENRNTPDPARIHQIDDGDYQGTLVFVIGAKGYQPDNYWYVRVCYGSCSGCDTLESIGRSSGEPPTPQQISDYMVLALHIVQGLHPMQGETV